MKQLAERRACSGKLSGASSAARHISMNRYWLSPYLRSGRPSVGATLLPFGTQVQRDREGFAFCCELGMSCSLLCSARDDA